MPKHRLRFVNSLSLILVTVVLISAFPVATSSGQQTDQKPAESTPTPEQKKELDGINKRAVEAHGKGELMAAEALWKQGLDRATALHNAEYTARFTYSLGTIYYSEGIVDTALDYEIRALAMYETIGNQAAIASCLNVLGAVYYGVHQNDKALDYFVRAAAIRELIGSQAEIAGGLYNLGNVYYALGQKTKALEVLMRALPIREKIGVRADIAATLNNLGAINWDLGRNGKALDYFIRALAIRETLGNQADIGATTFNLGNVYSSLGQNDKAIDFYTRALAIREKSASQSAVAVTLNNMGSVYANMGDNDKALEYYGRTLAMRETTGNLAEIAGTVNNIANVYWDLGQNDKAIDCHNRSLAIFEKIGNQAGIASNLDSLGLVYNNLGQNGKALDYHSRALTIFAKIGDQATMAGTLNNLGNVYANLGQTDKAVDYHTSALAIREKIGNQGDIAASQLNLASAYADLGQSNKALAFMSAALTIFEKHDNQSRLADTLNNLALYYNTLGQNGKAVDVGTRALAIYVKIGNRAEISNILHTLGIVYQSKGQYDTVLNYYSRSLAIEEQIGNQAHIAGTLSDLGVAYSSLSRFDEADKSYAESRRLQELVSLQISAPSQVGAIQDRYHQFYERYALLRLKRHRPDEALEMLEAGRGQGLSRQAAANGFDFTGGLSPEEAKQVKQAQSSLAAAAHLFKSAQDRLYAEPAGSPPLVSLQTRKDEAQHKLEAEQKSFAVLRDKLITKYPQYRDLSGAAVPTIAQLNGLASSHPDTLYVEIAPVDDKVTLVATLSKSHGVKFLELPIGEKELRSQAAAWRNAIGLRWERGQTAPAPAKNVSGRKRSDPRGPKFVNRVSGSGITEELQASTLYRELIAPLEKAGLLPRESPILPHPTLSRGERAIRPTPNAQRRIRLCIVASGPLLDLPFAALRDNQGRRLVERYAISSSIALGTFIWPPNSHRPTASLLCAADPIGTKPERSGGALPVLPVADAAVTVAQTRDAVFRSNWRGDYASLPGARNEGRAVAALFPNSLFVAGPEAKKAMLVDQLPKYNILHFATHGYLDAKEGMRSGLVLAHERSSSEDDTVLEAKEIASLPLSAEMAVLSACHTGQGQASSGEGVIGLAWAFRAAGVPSVVASQWSVDDAATKDWMVTFYGAIKAGKPKDEAVQAAMLAIKKAHPSPFYWAAFELIGDASPIAMR